MSKLTVLGIIPARAGSKGIPGKNSREIDGHPLIYYTLREAKKANDLTDLVVSSNDPASLNESRNLGVKAFERPENLSGSDSPVIDTVFHVLDEYSKKGFPKPDAVMILQPTAPLRMAADIDSAVRMIQERDGDSVVSVCEAPHHLNPYWVRKIENGYLKDFFPLERGAKHLMRQQLPKVYWRNGMIYLFRTSVLLEHKNFYGEKCVPMIMPPRFLVNLDEMDDWWRLEMLIEKKVIRLNPEIQVGSFESPLSE